MKIKDGRSWIGVIDDSKKSNTKFLTILVL